MTTTATDVTFLTACALFLLDLGIKIVALAWYRRDGVPHRPTRVVAC
jgi:hypothetical protein